MANILHSDIDHSPCGKHSNSTHGIYCLQNGALQTERELHRAYKLARRNRARVFLPHNEE
jgi:hypothetical protein